MSRLPRPRRDSPTRSPAFSLALAMLCAAGCGGAERRPLEQPPGDVLYHLAEELGVEGDRPAQVKVLRYLTRRHPRSRFAHAAVADLVELGELPPGTSLADLADAPSPLPAPAPSSP